MEKICMACFVISFDAGRVLGFEFEIRNQNLHTFAIRRDLQA